MNKPMEKTKKGDINNCSLDLEDTMGSMIELSQ